jgi:outer membrane receptor protein involved in Fe transport
MGSAVLPFGVKYQGNLEIFTVELNQLCQFNRLTLSVGSRYQWGKFDTEAVLTNPPFLVMPPPFDFFTNAVGATQTSDDFDRISGYGYLTAEPLERLWLTGGFAYEDMTFPRNFRHPPISAGEDHRSLLGPKAAVVWEPAPQVAIRGLYAESLGGVSLDDSYRLETTQLAGFPQAFRNLLPESVVGSVAAPEYRSYGGALDLEFPSGTYVGVQYERLEGRVRQEIGYFLLEGGVPPYMPRSTVQTLDYGEHSVVASLNQLLGRDFVLGVSYKFSHVELRDRFPQIPAPVVQPVLPDADRTVSAALHEVRGYLLLNHPSGLFARAESHWYGQSNAGYDPALPGDDFFPHNLFAGYRFAHRHAELLLGILNLGDQDYRLNPLNVYSELPRERTFMAQLRFEF